MGGIISQNCWLDVSEPVVAGTLDRRGLTCGRRLVVWGLLKALLDHDGRLFPIRIPMS
jgi:hypothetical protein